MNEGRDPREEGGRNKESTVAISTTPVTILIQYLLEQSSLDCAEDKLSCTNLVHFHLIVMKTHFNCYPHTKS